MGNLTALQQVGNGERPLLPSNPHSLGPSQTQNQPVLQKGHPNVVLLPPEKKTFQ